MSDGPKLPIHHVTTAAALREACAVLSTAEVVGLDVETTLYTPRVLCLV